MTSLYKPQNPNINRLY